MRGTSAASEAGEYVIIHWLDRWRRRYQGHTTGGVALSTTHRPL